MSKYKLIESSKYLRDVKKFKKDKQSIKLLLKTLVILSHNPFDTKLRTHKVDIPEIGKVWSSRVSGELRLIWKVDENKNLVLVLLRFAGHDTVYS